MSMENNNDSRRSSGFSSSSSAVSTDNGVDRESARERLRVRFCPTSPVEVLSTLSQVLWRLCGGSAEEKISKISWLKEANEVVFFFEESINDMPALDYALTTMLLIQDSELKLRQFKMEIRSYANSGQESKLKFTQESLTTFRTKVLDAMYKNHQLLLAAANKARGTKFY